MFLLPTAAQGGLGAEAADTCCVRLQAKAYSGLTGAEIHDMDDFIRRSTVEKFGLGRTVKPEIVCGLAFEGMNLCPHHKAGIAVRFPRIARLRRNKTVHQAYTL